jgi:hypothetical protein
MDVLDRVRAMLSRLALLAVVAALVCAGAAAAQTITRVDVPRALSAQIDRVNDRTDHPVLLPSRLPSEQARLYASGGRTRGGYELELAAAPDCGGANVCFVATFMARRGGEPRGQRRVRLSNGRRGWFTATRCAASCAPPQIKWRERGHLYTIEARVGTQATERRELAKLANSAIINGPRR